MARLALRAVGLEMDVIALMATVAVDRERDLRIHRPIVAGAAGKHRMPCLERERGTGVLETRLLPPRRVVALATGRAEPLLVVVALRVAGDAFGARLLERRARMAVLAWNRGMAADERERGAAVFKSRLAPRRFAVAACAVLAEPAAMRIVAGMARGAL